MRIRLLVLTLGVSVALHAQNNPAVNIAVDAAANRHKINPNIYGIAFGSTAEVSDLNEPLNRYGGNAATRYNWQINASNRSEDYFFESIGEASSTPGELVDTFINDSKAAGAQPMITVPIMGWVAKLGPNRAKLASFLVSKYGAQQYTDPYMPDAGNGRHPDGSVMTGNDPNDACIAVDGTFASALVQHIVTAHGNAASGGLRYYLLDNESSIWHGAHRDVHPIGATMDEVWSKMRDHAERIKAIDSGAIVSAPEEWGWSGFLYSGYDQQWLPAHGYCCTPDKDAHGGADYSTWLLDQFNYYDITHNKRLLDVFTLHFYPQNGEFGDPPDLSNTMQLTRNRSTRALWDPSYTDESWIADQVKLIPRMRDWVDTHYPGTLIGLTEYNWGAEGHINGATAQADILGILGRENADLATRWTTPASTTPTYKAMKLYRNYDGAKSTFGDISTQAGGPNPDNVAVFSAVRSGDRALTIMLVSKALTGNTPATINLANYAASGNAQQWQLTSANTINHLADVVRNGSILTLVLPPQSITLLVVPGTSDVTFPSIALGTAPAAQNGTFTFTGTAADDVGIASVKYTLAGATTGSGTATGTTAWTAPIHPNRGMTRITFTAYDAAGNATAIRSAIVIGASAPSVGRRRAAG
ncbi:MAG TPA: glycoside hydrolase family 44 protein [Thermoanaerobaculia bacterium]|nr:glycoside hydrolase family 44 protein [Thermoanaerobaculia bacterium]